MERGGTVRRESRRLIVFLLRDFVRLRVTKLQGQCCIEPWVRPNIDPDYRRARRVDNLWSIRGCSCVSVRDVLFWLVVH